MDVAAGDGTVHPAPYNSEGVPSLQLPREPGKDGHLATLGDTLDALGINYQGMFFAAGFQDISAGVSPGHFGGQGMFINDVDVDLGKLASIHGAKIHVEVNYYPFTYPTGQPTSVNFGTWTGGYLASDQYPPHAADAPWLSLLTWEQLLFNDRLDVEVGKTNLLRYFFGPNCGVDFTCTDSLIKFSSGLEDASLGSMGAHIKYNLTPNSWVEGGVQQLREYSAYQAKNGWDFTSIDHGEGALMIGGIGYHTDFSQNPYPSDYRLDYYYANTQVSDPYTDATHWGSGGVAFKMQQTIWSQTGALASGPLDAPRSLAVFASIEHSFDPARPVSWGGQLGLMLTRPFQGLPGFTVDQITFMTLYDRISRSELLAQRATRVGLGGPDETTSPNTFRFELNTTLGFGRHVVVQPAIEYILNPDSSQTSSARLPRSGWLAGVTTIVTFGNPHQP